MKSLNRTAVSVFNFRVSFISIYIIKLRTEMFGRYPILKFYKRSKV